MTTENPICQIPSVEEVRARMDREEDSNLKIVLAACGAALCRAKAFPVTVELPLEPTVYVRNRAIKALADKGWAVRGGERFLAIEPSDRCKP